VTTHGGKHSSAVLATEHLKKTEDVARTVSDVLRMAGRLGANGDREHSPLKPLIHLSTPHTRRDGGEHVLVLIVIADAQHKVDRSLGVRAAQYAIGHRALVDTGEAHLYDSFDR